VAILQTTFIQAWNSSLNPKKTEPKENFKRSIKGQQFSIF